MPATHPKVTAQNCGEQMAAGQTIPAQTLFSPSGKTTAEGNDCASVTAGELFYKGDSHVADAAAVSLGAP